MAGGVTCASALPVICATKNSRSIADVELAGERLRRRGSARRLAVSRSEIDPVRIRQISADADLRREIGRRRRSRRSAGRRRRRGAGCGVRSRGRAACSSRRRLRRRSMATNSRHGRPRVRTAMGGVRTLGVIGRGGGPFRTPGGRARWRFACTPASSRCWHAPAVPGRSAEALRPSAYEWQTSVARCVA